MVLSLLARQSAILFDAGTTGVRACQVVRRRGQYAVTDVLSVAAGDAAATRSAVDCQRLGRLAQQGRFSGRDVGLVLAPPHVQFHVLRVPPNIFQQPAEQIHSALAWEIARETRADAKELEVRYWPLPPGHSEGLNVVAAALPAAQAHAWVAGFQAAGWRLRRIDVAPCALARAAMCGWTPHTTDAWGIADIGAGRTVVTVMIGETPIYVRALTTGSRRWAQVVAEAFEASPREAEEITRAAGIQVIDRGVRSAPGTRGTACETDALPAILFNALRPQLETLCRELILCFSYALGSYSEAAVSRLVLAGGGSQLAGLDDYLTSVLDFPVHILGDALPNGLGEACRAHPEAAAVLGSAILDVEAR